MSSLAIAVLIAFAAGTVFGMALMRAWSRALPEAIGQATRYHAEPDAFERAMADWSELPGNSVCPRARPSRDRTGVDHIDPNE